MRLNSLEKSLAHQLEAVKLESFAFATQELKDVFEVQNVAQNGLAQDRDHS